VRSTRDVARLSFFVALVAALGFLRQILLPIPNVELMSLAAFLAGAMLGKGAGAVAGGAAMGIYSLLNPLGPAPPPVYAAQVLGLAIFGFAGGLLAKAPARAVILGAAGFLLTFIYDVLTNLGTVWVMGAFSDPWPVLVGGLLFGAGHMAWNTAAFALAGPPLLRWIARQRAKTP